MYGQWYGNSSNNNPNKNKPLASSPSTEIADSGIASRTTPLSSINDRKLFINPTIDDDNESIVTENHCFSFNSIDLHKRMIVVLCAIRFSISLSLATLVYKKCRENVQYPNCLVTYLDHPSAIFIQTPEDGSAFQQMHQDMK